MWQSDPHGQSGFTLAEMLIVVVLIGIASALIIPRFESMTGAHSSERSFRMIDGALSRAQDMALIYRREQILELNLDEPSLSIKGFEKTVSLPSKARIRILKSRSSKSVEAGTVNILIDRFGTVEPFELFIGNDIHATANPFTGVLEL